MRIPNPELHAFHFDAIAPVILAFGLHDDWRCADAQTVRFRRLLLVLTALID